MVEVNRGLLPVADDISGFNDASCQIFLQNDGILHPDFMKDVVAEV